MPALTWNSYLTNKSEASGALILPPPPPLLLSISAPIWRYLKLHVHWTGKRKKSKEGFEVTPENWIWDLLHRRPRTNCRNLSWTVLILPRVVKSSQLQVKIAAYLVSIGWLLCLAFLYRWCFLNKISFNWPLTLTTQPSTSKLFDNPAFFIISCWPCFYFTE